MGGGFGVWGWGCGVYRVASLLCASSLSLSLSEAFFCGVYIESPLSPIGPLLVSRTGDAGFTESMRKVSE